MNQHGLTIGDLRAAIDDIGTRFARLSDDDRFVLWFFRAYVTESEERAAEAVAGGARDKNIDGLLIDDAARAVFVVQAKYRKTPGQKAEKRDDVLSFAGVAAHLCDADTGDFAQYTATMEQYSAERFKEARKRVLNHGYQVMLYFVTLGKISASTRRDAEAALRHAGHGARIAFIDWNRVVVLFRDYIDGVAPPIPTLDLEMEKCANVTVNGVAQRYDDLCNIESWVFSMRGDAVAALYEFAGPRIFARNIRGYLGASTEVNRSMVATLRTDPDKFFYYNNGVTIICDEAAKHSRQGKDVLQVGNPQIINGQQTTRTLAAHANESRKASVLVKVIRVPRNDAGAGNGFESLVSSIVAGTNWQNKITASDLMSNDRVQIDLERSFRNLGYLYIRKRQSKGEARRSAPGKYYKPIRKEEIAQAVAACEMDPWRVRQGKEKLFEEDLYPKVFPNADPNYYLSRYRLLREVTRGAHGNPDRGYAKWLALNFVWSHLAPAVRAAKHARAFRIQTERNGTDLARWLSRAIDKVFREISGYYRQTRGSGDATLDISRFFRDRKNHHLEFEKYWRNAKSKHAFSDLMAKVQDAIEEFDE